MKHGSNFPNQTKTKKNILELHGILTKKDEEHDMAIQMGLHVDTFVVALTNELIEECSLGAQFNHGKCGH
jgi:hypothetical protein